MDRRTTGDQAWGPTNAEIISNLGFLKKKSQPQLCFCVVGKIFAVVKNVSLSQSLRFLGVGGREA
jgi:hypothetical protein